VIASIAVAGEGSGVERTGGGGSGCDGSGTAAIVTPHIAARMTGTIKENIRQFAEGQPLLNVVDKSKGY